MSGWPLSVGRRGLLAGACAASLLGRRAWAGRPLTLLVGAAAGSPQDQAARAFAPFLERHLAHSVVWVSNHPSASGLAAFRALADAEPTGQTLGWVATPALPARSVDHPDAASLLARVRLVGAVSREPIIFVAAADTPITSAPELVRQSAQDADALPLGTPPSGSAPHLAALRLQALAGTALNIVAFPSAAAARQAALAGNVAGAALGLGDALEALQSGHLTGLGIASGKRARAVPDIATLGESGLMLSAAIQRGLAVTVGTQDDVCAAVAAALRDIVADPEFVAQGDSNGFAVDWLDGPAWSARTQTERAALLDLWRTSPWAVSEIG